MEKQFVKIPDVLFFQEGPGVRNTQYTSYGVKLLNVANLVDGRLDLSTSDRYISNEEAYGKYKHFLCEAGDFIIASSGIKVDYIDKKMGFVEDSMLPLCMNTSTIRFRVLDSDVLRIRFFMYYLKSNHFKSQLSHHITGSAQLNYGPSHLKKMVMPIVSIELQDEIINKLDRIQKIISARQKELATLDELIKARFVEMFGTIHNNQNEYEIKSLQDVCEPIKDGTHQTPKYTDDRINGFKFLSSKDVTTGRINWDNIKYIPVDLHEQLYARIQPKKGDVLLAKNGTTGIAAIVDRDEIFDIYVSLALLKPLNINSIYLWAAINSQETKEQFEASLKGIGVPNLHLGEIKKAKIIVPPIELQSKFADFVQQVDKSKVVVQKALNETQLLFDSLMQQYFG